MVATISTTCWIDIPGILDNGLVGTGVTGTGLDGAAELGVDVELEDEEAPVKEPIIFCTDDMWDMTIA